MTTEKLRADLEDIEVVIRNLNHTSNRIEELKDNTSDFLVIDNLKQFLKKLESEIDWNEQIKDEIEQSIKFIELKGGN